MERKTLIYVILLDILVELTVFFVFNSFIRIIILFVLLIIVIHLKDRLCSILKNISPPKNLLFQE